MKCRPLPIVASAIFSLDTHVDARGTFSRAWCRKDGPLNALPFEIAQINISSNPSKGTLRGLHYQRHPHAEQKLVYCIQGTIHDVILDLRPDSPTYLQWVSVTLSHKTPQALYIPAGCAHGFQTLEDDTTLLYLISEYYTPSASSGIRYDDPAFGIEWPLPVSALSERDQQWIPFQGNADVSDNPAHSSK